MVRRSIFSRARSAVNRGKKKARDTVNKAKSNYKAKQQRRATKKYVKKQNKKNKRADRKAEKTRKKQSRKSAVSSFFSKAKSNYKANQQRRATKKYVKKQNKKNERENRKEKRADFLGNMKSRFSQIGLGALAIPKPSFKMPDLSKFKLPDLPDLPSFNIPGISDKLGDVWDGVTAPFTKSAETASKFKTIMKFAGLALIAFVLWKVFKK